MPKHVHIQQAKLTNVQGNHLRDIFKFFLFVLILILNHYLYGAFKRRFAGGIQGGISDKAWEIYAAKNLWKFHLFKYELHTVKIPVKGTVTTPTVKGRKDSRGPRIEP